MELTYLVLVLLPCLVTVMGVIPDWLVTKVTTPTRIVKTPEGNLKVDNGLIYREFTLHPDFATVDYFSYEKESSLLRAISPEAVISLDDVIYNVGGLVANIPWDYLNRTALKQQQTYDPHAFHYSGHKVADPVAPYSYQPKRGAPKDIVWPPRGKRLDVMFRAPATAPSWHQRVTVTIHYEMYDGIPLLRKWVTIQNSPTLPEVMASVISVEYLAVNWPWAQQGYNWLYVGTDRAHGAVARWDLDPHRQDMPGSFEAVVNCSYSVAPLLILDSSFESFSVHELVIGSNDPERAGLAKRRLLRLLAPQTQENPIFFHMVNNHSSAVRELLDQMANVGFEMMFYSFGSGFNLESASKAYMAEISEIVIYAASRGIEIGAYDLIALTRHVKKQWMANNQSACFASGWYDFLRFRILDFMENTGMTAIETDGPYGGYSCPSQTHAYHHGYQDSVYQQDLLQGKFYMELQSRGVYINEPDNYFFQGGSKTGMGYNENQYSLPRWQDLSISRQDVYDRTFLKIPTVGWMHVPLVQYHGGGKAAQFEPLSEHRLEYEWALAQYLGGGVAAAYRGHRLYDNEDTKAMVTKWVKFYKRYRDILISDIIHVRFPDMQSIDCYMHVNPYLKIRGLAMVFNPTAETRNFNLTLPLYYTGLHDIAQISQENGKPIIHKLNRDYTISVHMSLPPNNITWLLIQ